MAYDRTLHRRLDRRLSDPEQPAHLRLRRWASPFVGGERVTFRVPSWFNIGSTNYNNVRLALRVSPVHDGVIVAFEEDICMPRWGLTEGQRNHRPWGLKESLEPGKVVTDPIHGDIYLTKLEQAVFDTPAMQRLRRVKQLGMTHVIYPGATHTRFAHSLGSLRAAQDLLDAAVAQRHGPDPSPDLFLEWDDDKILDKELARATVLVRLGAATHDLCHIPYGHSIEDDLHFLDPHDKNVARFERLWNELVASVPAGEMREALEGPLGTALRPLILSREHEDDESHVPSEEQLPYPFALDIVGNTICADLLDYLRRDHLFTGLPLSLGHRFMDGFYVAQSGHPYFARHMVVRIARAGRIRHDVVTELFKYLRYRYELGERALNHHAKLAADAMVAKILEIWRDRELLELAAQDVDPCDPDHSEVEEVLDRLQAMPGGAERMPAYKAAALEKIEALFLRSGDDGLLERLLERTEGGAGRSGIIHELATGLVDRRLYKRVAYCSSARALSRKIHATYGSPERRRELESGAVDYAAIGKSGSVVLWIPRPRMGMKAAEVLVDDGDMIAPLAEWDQTSGRRGQEIYDSHHALWAIGLYAHPDLRSQPQLVERAKAYLAHELQIRWDGGAISTTEADDLAAVHELAIREVAEDNRLSPQQAQELTAAVGSAREAAARRTPGNDADDQTVLSRPYGQPFPALKAVVERIWGTLSAVAGATEA